MYLLIFSKCVTIFGERKTYQAPQQMEEIEKPENIHKTQITAFLYGIRAPILV